MKAISILIRKKLFLLIITGLIGLSCMGQGPGGASDFWSNVRYGGGLGLGFGSDSFSIYVAPSAIYQISPQFGAGIALSYNYSEFGESRFNAFGGSLLSYFNPIPAIQFSAEFEETRVQRKEEFLGMTFEEKYWSPALFFGVGFGNRNVMVGLRYDVLYDEGKSIYADPWVPFVRVFF